MINMYLKGYSVIQISKYLGCDPSTIRKILKVNGIISRRTSKIVEQFDLLGNFILLFDSTIEVKKWLFEKGITTNKTANCCRMLRLKK